MSIFKNHKTIADRSATDRSRHKKKIKEALKKGIHNIVSDESIIGKDGKKKLVIPVRGIKEYRFVYGSNEKNKQVGSAQGKQIRKGQKIGNSNQRKKAPGEGKPGNEAGEEFYEVEITLEELSEYLFDSLNLPDLEKKNFKNLVGEKFKRSGYKSSGIRPRLSKKETLKRKIRRKKSIQRISEDGENDERFPFHESDLKYKRIKNKPKENNNAVIFFIMDVSGSMTQKKKFMARSFFFLLYHFLRHKYEKTDIVFISHTSEAREVSEDEFFTRSNSGGTYISSGLEKCLEIIDKRYHRESWNIYAFHCSDGDNWPEDNQKAINFSMKLKTLSQLYCFIQVNPGLDGNFWSEGGMSETYKPISDSKFKIVHLNEEEQVWTEFKRIFGGSANE